MKTLKPKEPFRRLYRIYIVPIRTSYLYVKV